MKSVLLCDYWPPYLTCGFCDGKSNDRSRQEFYAGTYKFFLYEHSKLKLVFSLYGWTRVTEGMFVLHN